jgi:hypothetical protein
MRQRRILAGNPFWPGDEARPGLGTAGRGRDQKALPTESISDPLEISPVTKQSGRMRFVVIRRARNMFLRAKLHLWAGRSRVKSSWADAYYWQNASRA